MIRRLIESDLEILNTIGNRVKDNFNIYYSIKDLMNKEYVTINVYDNNGIKGFVYYEDHIDFIDLIAIAAFEDSKGIGSLLMNDMILNNKGKRIMLEVREDNKNAISLYNKFGFKEINRRKNYYDGIDAIIMEVSICE